MFIRVVRFTGVSAERMQSMRGQVEERGGPPEGVPSTAIKVLFDESQGTAVVLQYFDSAEDMQKGAEILSAMDPSDTPGTRASVDACEVIFEAQAG